MPYPLLLAGAHAHAVPPALAPGSSLPLWAWLLPLAVLTVLAAGLLLSARR